MKKFLLVAMALFGLAGMSFAAANTATMTPTSRNTRTHTNTKTPTNTPTQTLTPTPVFSGNLFVDNVMVSKPGYPLNVAQSRGIAKYSYGSTYPGYEGIINLGNIHDDMNVFSNTHLMLFSHGKILIDADSGTEIDKYTSQRGPGTDSFAFYIKEKEADEADTPVPLFIVNVQCTPTTTTTPGYNDFYGCGFFNQQLHYVPTPAAAGNAANKAYVDAGVNAVATPAHLAYAIATYVVPVATAFPAVATAVIDLKPIATRAYMIQAVGTPNAVPEFVGQFYLATDTNKLSIGINPTSTPDPSNWTPLN